MTSPICCCEIMPLTPLQVAGHSSRLESEIKLDQSGDFTDLINVPKALLPGRSGLLLDGWLETRARVAFSEIILVTNSEKVRARLRYRPDLRSTSTMSAGQRRTGWPRTAL